MERTQELYSQFRALKQQHDMLEDQLDLLQASLGNIYNTKTTLENLKNVKDGEEILLPLGGLANLKATIKDPEKVILYIAQDIAIEKDLNYSIEYLKKLIEQHNNQIQYISTQLQTSEANLQSMSQNIQRNMQNNPQEQ